jgi:membrane protein required for colicin V production
MNVFDLIVLAILIALTLRGIWKGMVSQIVSVASFFVCWIVATRFGWLLAPTIPIEAPWNQVLAMAAIFFITLIATRFVYAALEKLIKHWQLKKLNTLLGGMLGFTKGLLLCLIITFFSVMVAETSREVVFNSKSGFHLVRLITQIGMFVPKDSYEFVHAQLEFFQSKVDEAEPYRSKDMFASNGYETIMQTFGQLHQTTEKIENAGSLFAAMSRWWNGSQEDTDEIATEYTETEFA